MKPRRTKPRAFEKSCGAILFQEGKEPRFLLLKYLAGHWGFARGHAESGESEKETAMREIEEETGIRNIKLLRGFRERARFSFWKKGKNVQKQVVFFLGEAPRRAVKLSSEHLGYLWLTYSEAMNRLTYSSAKKVLKKARNFLESSHRRERTKKTEGAKTGIPKRRLSSPRQRRTQAVKNRIKGKRLLTLKHSQHTFMSEK